LQLKVISGIRLNEQIANVENREQEDQQQKKLTDSQEISMCMRMCPRIAMDLAN
jgi:hypothetical protein